jgi:hypothetical protein
MSAVASERVLEPGAGAKFGLDIKEAVVLCQPLAPAGRVGLHLAATHRHCEIGNERVGGLAQLARWPLQ